MSVIENIREHGLKYVTPKRIWLYLRSKFRKVLGLRIKEKDSIKFAEVITYKSLTCPDCVELGHCRICKCPIGELFSAMDTPCSDGKFPEFESDDKSWKEGWEEYKKENNVFFTKFYG